MLMPSKADGILLLDGQRDIAAQFLNAHFAISYAASRLSFADADVRKHVKAGAAAATTGANSFLRANIIITPRAPRHSTRAYEASRFARCYLPQSSHLPHYHFCYRGQRKRSSTVLRRPRHSRRTPIATMMPTPMIDARAALEAAQLRRAPLLHLRPATRRAAHAILSASRHDISWPRRRIERAGRSLLVTHSSPFFYAHFKIRRGLFSISPSPGLASSSPLPRTRFQQLDASRLVSLHTATPEAALHDRAFTSAFAGRLAIRLRHFYILFIAAIALHAAH